MHPQIESAFNEAENRYLHPEELGVITQYVESLPKRMHAYRTLRDKEMTIMQQVADQLVKTLPGETTEALERSIKNALLVMRYCAMGMLLNNEAFVKERLHTWMGQSMKAYHSQTIDFALYELLTQSLNQSLTPQQLSFFNPMLAAAQAEFLPQDQPLTAAALGW